MKNCEKLTCPICPPKDWAQVETKRLLARFVGLGGMETLLAHEVAQALRDAREAGRLEASAGPCDVDGHTENMS